jgi:maltooligosyltrehalose trehalohydrolase
MKRRHSMPFGAEMTAEGVRFGLWAPAARTVDVGIGSADDALEWHRMAGDAKGWHSIVAANAAPGNRYRFRIDGSKFVPDPASRSNPDDVHSASQVIDPCAFEWTDDDWRGRPWREAAIYELHVGAFTPAGTFAGVSERLAYLVELGVTAIELMPIGDFPGRRNWGYDGVLPFAPDASYGTPDDLKRLVVAAHRRGLMVLLDIVYNHFGPEGNYLHAYSPQFFTARHRTPWGDAIDFDGPRSAMVREFFVHNALYWLEEFHLDGLRFAALNASA